MERMYVNIMVLTLNPIIKEACKLIYYSKVEMQVGKNEILVKI
jgi:hypothetical protein